MNGAPFCVCVFCVTVLGPPVQSSTAAAGGGDGWLSKPWSFAAGARTLGQRGPRGEHGDLPCRFCVLLPGGPGYKETASSGTRSSLGRPSGTRVCVGPVVGDETWTARGLGCSRGRCPKHGPVFEGFVFELHFHLLNRQEGKGWAPAPGPTSGAMGRTVPRPRGESRATRAATRSGSTELALQPEQLRRRRVSVKCCAPILSLWVPRQLDPCALSVGPRVGPGRALTGLPVRRTVALGTQVTCSDERASASPREA